jgi:DNA-binding response OmpR family regulator
MDSKDGLLMDEPVDQEFDDKNYTLLPTLNDEYQRKRYAVKDVKQIVLYPEEYVCYWKNNKIDFTITEWDIINLLLNRPRVVFNRDQIIAEIDPTLKRDVDDRTIDSHIKRIRKKFVAVDPNFNYIITVYGGGYCFIRD